MFGQYEAQLMITSPSTPVMSNRSSTVGNASDLLHHEAQNHFLAAYAGYFNTLSIHEHAGQWYYGFAGKRVLLSRAAMPHLVAACTAHVRAMTDLAERHPPFDGFRGI